MQLSPEMMQAAQSLGSLLNAQPAVTEYRLAKARVDQDADALELENSHLQLYNQLIERQDRGEALDQADLDHYYALGRRLQNHPLIAGRDLSLENVKSLYAAVAEKMTATLGLEYTDFAR